MSKLSRLPSERFMQSGIQMDTRYPFDPLRRTRVVNLDKSNIRLVHNYPAQEFDR